jgi:hypothetical protein
MADIDTKTLMTTLTSLKEGQRILKEKIEKLATIENVDASVGKPISDLPEVTSISDADFFPLVKNSITSKASFKAISASKNERVVTASFNTKAEDLLSNTLLITPQPVGTNINILCTSIDKATFEANFGVGTIRKIVRIELDKSIISTGAKTTTASSIATHSLTQLYGSVLITTNSANEPKTRGFAGAFYDQYIAWQDINEITTEIATEYRHTVQLVFEGEYIEVEWRDWDDTGSFAPWVRHPKWYKGVRLDFGAFQKKDSYFFEKISGVLGSTHTTSYSDFSSGYIEGVDLGDILSADHPLKYRLAMLIPNQTTPNCVSTGGLLTDFKNDTIWLLRSKNADSYEKISKTMYAGIGYLMYDNASLTYMPVPLANRALKGFGSKKVNDSTRTTIQLAELNCVLDHIHNSTATSTFAGGTVTSLFLTGSVDAGNDYYGAATNLTTVTGTVTTTISNPTPSSTRHNKENRVDAIYTPMYIRF